MNNQAVQDMLEIITPNVYFQPPPSFKLEYPCIVYERSGIPKKNADNTAYKLDVVYTVTVIDTRPDSNIIKSIIKLPMCSYNRSFRTSNLNHDVFRLVVNDTRRTGELNNGTID